MFRLCFPLLLFSFLSGCAGPSAYVYRYVPGRTAVVENGFAVAPPAAPQEVQTAIAAGNRIAGSAYRYGGGHRQNFDGAYDCSGATSFVLQAIGRLDSSTTSRGFRHYGERGEGDWISVYARRGHVFLVVAGLRFDTGYSGAREGVKWTTRSRPTNGYVVRHPARL
jgi:hypothetical protein